MKRIFSQISPDQIGAISAGLCLLHCTVLPIALLAVSGSAHASDAFHGLEYVFLLVGLLAVWHATKVATSRTTAIALVSVYAVMLGAILVELLVHIHLHYLVYAASIALIVLHVVNFRQCRRCTVHAK